MIKFVSRHCCLLFFLFLTPLNFAAAATITGHKIITLEKSVIASDDDDNERTVVIETSRIIAEIVTASYPELKNAKFIVKAFESETDYFHSRFSFGRFLTFRKMRYLIFVNARVFEKNAPIEAIRAIIAHELAHAAYYRRHRRFELLGLVNLQSKKFTVKFERGADLQAIGRGYGAGLISYRKWLYDNVPNEKVAAKKRDYFSPEEIELILKASKEIPALLDYLINNVPQNLAEIQLAIKSQTLPAK